MSEFEPSLLKRDDKVCLTIPNDPTVSHYTVGVANTLDNAIGASVGGTGVYNLFTFQAKQDYISDALQTSGRGSYLNYARGGRSYAYFTFDEFYDSATPQTVLDGQVGYIRVTRTFYSGTSQASPILVVPPHSFYGQNAPTMTLTGNAPAVTYTDGDPIPDTGPAVIQVPQNAKSVLIKNTSSTSSDILYLSYSREFPAIAIGGGDEHTFRPQTVSDIILFGSVVVPFQATMSIALGSSL